MPPLQPIKIYTYLSLARSRLLDSVRPLGTEAYHQSFPIGLGSLARTLTHMMISEQMYVQRMQARPVPPYDQWPIRDEHPPEFTALDIEWTKQAAATREAIALITDWDTELEYTVESEGRPVVITASPTDIFTQLAFHEIHHRAQAMNMLRRLGAIVEDLDYNTLMYKRRDAESLKNEADSPR